MPTLKESDDKIAVYHGHQLLLTFVPDALHRDAWKADWEHSPQWTKEYYSVYPWKKGYAVARPEHPVLGRFSGRYPTRKRAILECAEDFGYVARLQRWIEHMKTHEPPPPGDD